jgi:hypothetical protein
VGTVVCGGNLTVEQMDRGFASTKREGTLPVGNGKSVTAVWGARPDTGVGRSKSLRE